MDHEAHSTHSQTTKIDPVCGMNVTSSQFKAVDRNVEYWFCNPKCRDKFIANPKQYLEPSKNVKVQSNELYTCPMHPEVVSDKPGKCPKCKMDLVEKGSEDHSGHQH